MKIARSRLKELVRQSVREAEDWWSKLEPDEQASYIKAHPKSQKAQDAKKKAKGDDSGKDKPAYVKPSTTGQGYSYDEPSHADDVEGNWDKASKGFDSMADKYGVRIDDQSDWSGYENNPQGEYSVSGKNSEDPGDGFSVYSTVETGEDGESYEGNKNIIAFPQDDDPFGGQVEVKFDSIGDAQKALDDILSDKRIKKVLDGGRGSMAKAKDYIKKELESWEANPKISGADAADDANAKMDRDYPKDDTGGPSYANVPKGAKTSKQAKAMKAKKKEKDLNNTDDLIKQMSDPDYEDSLDDLINQMDQGEKGNVSPSEAYGLHKAEAERQLKKIKDVESGEMDWEMYANSKEAAIDYFKEELQDKLEMMKREKSKMKSKDESIKEDKGDMDKDGKDEPDSEEYMDNKDKAIKKAMKNEAVSPKKSTIREIAKWIKSLEESRYKKVSGADSRRVAWFVNNNLAEDYEQMPKSIVKKWSKAAYGRERYLAKEFINYRKKQMTETKKLSKNKLRKIIFETINEGKETIFDVATKVMKDSQMYVYQSKKGKVKIDMQTANLLTKVFKVINPKMKQILTKLGDDNPSQLVQTLRAVAK